MSRTFVKASKAGGETTRTRATSWWTRGATALQRDVAPEHETAVENRLMRMPGLSIWQHRAPHIQRDPVPAGSGWMIDEGHYYTDREGAVARARVLQQEHTSIEVFQREDETWQVRYKRALPTSDTYPFDDPGIYYATEEETERRADVLRAYGYSIEVFQRSDGHYQCRITRLVAGIGPGLPTETGPDQGYYYELQRSAEVRAGALRAVGFEVTVSQREDGSWQCDITSLPRFATASPGRDEPTTTANTSEPSNESVTSGTDESTDTPRIEDQENTSGGALPPQELVAISEENSAQLSDAVVQSYRDFADEVEQLTGQNILETVGDATRPLSSSTARVGADNVSWHKTGRAVDIRQDLQHWVLVEETRDSQTYIALYLRHSTPSTEADGDRIVNFVAGTDFYRSSFGTVSPTWAFVNVMAVATGHGWSPIAAQAGYQNNYNQEEWWHFERRDGRRWYDALLELYTEQVIIDSIQGFAPGARGSNRYAARLQREGVPPRVLREIFPRVTQGSLALHCPVGATRDAANLEVDVRSVQEALIRAGLLAEGAANGSIDDATIAAIESVQRDHANLSDPDGRVDVEGATHTALGNL